MQIFYGVEEWVRRGVGGRRTVERLLAARELPPPVRIGRSRRWSGEQIDAWISARVERAAGGEQQQRGPGRPRGAGAK